MPTSTYRFGAALLFATVFGVTFWIVSRNTVTAIATAVAAGAGWLLAGVLVRRIRR